MDKYRLLQTSVTTAFKALCRPVVTGTKNVPEHGPVIIASNHLSFLDSVILSVMMPRRVKFIAKAEYLTTPGVKGRIMRELFEMIDVIPVERGHQGDSVAALAPALEHLEQGKIFGIYPEGTRSRDGYLYRGRNGVAYLAYMTGAPVVPVGLVGTQRLQPPGSNVIRPARFELHVGEPIRVPRTGPRHNGRMRKELTEQVMDAIAALSGQPRKDTYNQSPSTEKDPERG